MDDNYVTVVADVVGDKLELTYTNNGKSQAMYITRTFMEERPSESIKRIATFLNQAARDKRIEVKD